jgi:cytochrome c-type biogenesis protein CcmH/NrfF
MLWLRVQTLGIRAALIVVASLALYGQSAEEIESPAVTHVVEKLNCTCGCKMNMACQMDPYPGCKICYAHRLRVLTMQKAGASDQAILDSISHDEGKAILVNPPGTLGALSFYSAGFLGLILVLFVIRKYRQKGVAGGAIATDADDPSLGRYHEQIEKETAKLD